MQKFKDFLLTFTLLVIILYPKFPLANIAGTFVAIRLEDILVAIVVAAGAFLLFYEKVNISKEPIIKSVLIYWLIGLVATFSGIFLTKSSTLALGLFHFFRRVEYMSLFVVGYVLMTKSVSIKHLVKLLMLISILVSIYGIGQQYFNFPVISTNNSEFSKGLALTLGPGARINSTFAGHYDLAAFTVLPLLLILAILPISKPKFPLYIIWLLTYWTLLMSASRITFAAFFISASLLLILIKKKLWLIPLGLIAIVGVFISPQLRGRYLQFFQNSFLVKAQAVDEVPDALKSNQVVEDRSFNIRLNVEWPRAIRSFQQNPILGTGFSSVGLAVDNEYLRILAETGLLGFVSFFLLTKRLINSFFSKIINYKPVVESAYVVSVFCFLVSLLLGGIFIDVFTASKIALTTWLLLGTTYKYIKISA